MAASLSIPSSVADCRIGSRKDSQLPYDYWKYAERLKPGLLWARPPLLFLAIAGLYGVIDRKRSPLDPVLRSLVTVRVSQINWCRFCIDINSATLLKRGASFDKVGALENWREAKLFDEREQVALEYAEAVTFNSALDVPPQGFRRLPGL